LPNLLQYFIIFFLKTNQFNTYLFLAKDNQAAAKNKQTKDSASNGRDGTCSRHPSCPSGIIQQNFQIRIIRFLFDLCSICNKLD
jgi:hypothetical protein